MWDFHYLLAPVVGGVIGYITNDIAIRMLFRPHQAKYVFGMHVPFTPGLIPKEKGRLAEAVGNTISENLMNKEVLSKYLLSEEMIDKIRSSVERFVEKQRHNPETVEQFFAHYLSEQEIHTMAEDVNKDLTMQLKNKLADSSVGDQVAEMAVGHVVRKLGGDGITELLAGISGLGGMATRFFGRDLVAKFLSLLREPAERLLSKNINDMLQREGGDMVTKLLGDEIEQFLKMPVCQLLKDKEEQLEQAPDRVESLYRNVINDHLPRILASVDISKIVRERINEMDVNETEQIIHEVMDKELKAIVWLGAGLGTLMGCINCLL